MITHFLLSGASSYLITSFMVNHTEITFWNNVLPLYYCGIPCYSMVLQNWENPGEVAGHPAVYYRPPMFTTRLMTKWYNTNYIGHTINQKHKWTTTVTLQTRHMTYWNMVTTSKVTAFITEAQNFKKRYENCTLLSYYATSSGNFLPTFQDKLAVPPSVVKNTKVLDPWRWEW
jgi:hypothetical protein